MGQFICLLNKTPFTIHTHPSNINISSVLYCVRAGDKTIILHHFYTQENNWKIRGHTATWRDTVICFPFIFVDEKTRVYTTDSQYR